MTVILREPKESFQRMINKLHQKSGSILKVKQSIIINWNFNLNHLKRLLEFFYFILKSKANFPQRNNDKWLSRSRDTQNKHFKNCTWRFTTSAAFIAFLCFRMLQRVTFGIPNMTARSNTHVITSWLSVSSFFTSSLLFQSTVLLHWLNTPWMPWWTDEWHQSRNIKTNYEKKIRNASGNYARDAIIRARDQLREKAPDVCL